MENLSLQTDSADQGVEINDLAAHLYEQFFELFTSHFSQQKNAAFLNFVTSALEKKQHKQLSQCFLKASKMGLAKISSSPASPTAASSHSSTPAQIRWESFQSAAEKFEEQRVASESEAPSEAPSEASSESSPATSSTLPPPPPTPPTPPSPSSELLDLLVIGAGPHSMSMLTRLVDDDPDLLTEAERSKVMLKAKTMRSTACVEKHLKKRFDASVKLPRTRVVDSIGRWLSQWRSDFKALNIEWLRSHENLHPCPFDFQSLSVWANLHRREAELKQMEHVDREACRKAGFYGPFVLPSAPLFLDFCDSLVDRYGLDELLMKGTVEDVRILPNKTFEVRLADGRIMFAKRVVAAMGPGPAFQGNRTARPAWAEELTASMTAASATRAVPDPAVIIQHACTLTKWLLAAENRRLIEGKRVLVVGGGQTAAHLSRVALKHGASEVTFCSRRRITKKPFDIDVDCMGDKRPEFLKRFRSLEPGERLMFNRKLRGGGSMSGCVHDGLCQCCDGKGLVLAEETQVEVAEWSEREGVVQVHFDNGEMGAFDFIWTATGATFNIGLIPVFASLNAQCEIDTFDGMPDLQPDLSWAKDVPFHVMGAFAQLQLGPDALNLAGARSGGVVVARAILQARRELSL